MPSQDVRNIFRGPLAQYRVPFRGPDDWAAIQWPSPVKSGPPGGPVKLQKFQAFRAKWATWGTGTPFVDDIRSAITSEKNPATPRPPRTSDQGHVRGGNEATLSRSSSTYLAWPPPTYVTRRKRGDLGRELKVTSQEHLRPRRRSESHRLETHTVCSDKIAPFHLETP